MRLDLVTRPAALACRRTSSDRSDRDAGRIRPDVAADLLNLLDKLNPLDPDTNRRAAQINCIQFLDADPLDTMKKIAQAHGGRGGGAFKFLTRKDLGLGGP